MPARSSLLPREGLTVDPMLSLINRTALNPAFLLPAVLLARFTKKGQNLSILHPLAFSRLKALFYFALAKWLSSIYSDGVVNNWTSDKYDWPNEIAVVTGGSGGIGGHVVRLLAGRGVKVVVLDIQPLTFDAPPNVYHYTCDLTSPRAISTTTSRIRAEVGAPTILINNAGVARGNTILATTPSDLRLTFDVNLFSHFHLVRALLPSMIARNHGMVVTVSSFAAWLTVPNMVDYGCSKAAAASFHEGLAAELKARYRACKVRTVVVNQGYTRTALFRGYFNERPWLLPTLEPETVAEAVARQVLTGRSGQVVLPTLGSGLKALRALPSWYSYRLRARAENIMTHFEGRQVVGDVERFYADREAGGEEEGESTVFVKSEQE